MKEYTIIGDFKFENNNYTVLLDDDKKYFFLKIKNKDEYEYITLQELVKLTNIFAHNENVLLIERDRTKKKRKIKLIPKILIGTLAITLSLALTSCIGSMNKYKLDLSKPSIAYTDTISYEESNDIISEDKTQKAIQELLEDIERDNKNFEVEQETEGLHLRIIYDNSKLDNVFNNKKEDITYDMIREIINNNTNIPKNFKEMYINLANNLENQYPTMDLRVWYENLKTLKVLEVDEMEMKIKAMSATAYACYRKDENTIYTVKGYDYQPGTWDYQVIIHEMCHPIRSGFFQKGDEEIRVQWENKSGNGVIIGEAMNSLLALRSYDQNEKDIAYQLQSNMIEAIIDSMDNYTYQDFVEHNITYFENELNIQNNDDKAVEILGLINLQYKDYHNDDISVDKETFHPIYDYISKMYYSKRITNNMTYEEAVRIKEELINRITYDVPEDYNIDIDHFNEYFETYCEQLGIINERTK